jgi:hypothetical protein
MGVCIDCALLMTLIGFPHGAPPVLVTLSAYVGPRMRRLVQGFVRDVLLPRRELEHANTATTSLLDSCRALLPPPSTEVKDAVRQRQRRVLENIDALADITVAEISRRVAAMKVAAAAAGGRQQDEEDDDCAVADVDVDVGMGGAAGAVAANADADR